ncbi:uncharacterized protein EDB91DRAFT_1166640 [Suillus paluster]|uniref:uncharacterized protein n=1 Tax=Suillus paluster TaxID=48578 RepID=UPI001B87C158|nr:uncharacterized protein EDB91DRAFT_1166581 [Suillus paluster]XP_041171257.1 uncharacterized protein EDB91DRAFT_1166640 [Suillus paluster]KAG1726177.1 hypothetical protein EDB91DRAFT_1166581 [Suillus paluster]KAG1726196.1 hypothetical protein EDB91DRAFT_1166640 [Suillus paluster]
MFTSRSIIFALLSFLVGVNAAKCVQCPATVWDNGTTRKLTKTSPGTVTVCTYGPVSCRYLTSSRQIVGGAQACPLTAEPKNC